jgi:hypothetical protein
MWVMKRSQTASTEQWERRTQQAVEAVYDRVTLTRARSPAISAILEIRAIRGLRRRFRTEANLFRFIKAV